MFRIPSKSRYTAIMLGIRIDPMIHTMNIFACFSESDWNFTYPSLHFDEHKSVSDSFPQYLYLIFRRRLICFVLSHGFGSGWSFKYVNVLLGVTD